MNDAYYSMFPSGCQAFPEGKLRRKARRSGNAVP